MSLGLERQPIAGSRFPRVSGDEPVLTLTRDMSV